MDIADYWRKIYGQELAVLLWGKQMRRSFLFGFLLTVLSITNSYGQEYRITDSSCIGWFRGPSGQDVPAATVNASVSDWKPYVTMEEGSRLINAILREFIPKCVQSGSKPLVFNVRISASSVPMRNMLHARYYVGSPGGHRLELVANNIGEFQQAERAAQQRVIDQQNAARDAAERARREAQLAEERSRQAAEDKRRSDQAAADAYNEQLKKAKEIERTAEDAAAARAKAKPADSFCMWSCDPLEDHGRKVLKNQMSQMFGTPVVVVNFTKTEGIKMAVAGTSLYEMRYTADLEFPLGFARRPKDYYDEMSKASDASANFMQLAGMMSLKQKFKGAAWWDPAAYSTAGLLRFMKVDRGWMGADNKVYQ